MIETKPALSFENGVMVNYSDLLAVAEEYKSLPDIIVTAEQGSRVAAVKSDLKKNADIIKKELKAEDKRRSEAFYEDNHGAVAAMDTLLSVREDLVERTNTWEKTRLDANMPVLEAFIDEQNELHHLDSQHQLIANNWRKLGTFTPTGKIVGKVQNEIVSQARLAEFEQNQQPELSPLDLLKRDLNSAFSDLYGKFEDDVIYSGTEVKEALARIAELLK
ncbi:MAG: hypothetical protein ABF723_12145 [Lentilactobacillus hilgardii]|uniref:hypothetical protein n=1 Tax=Lentilactobacillus hilgardii TaxID=1588 RepID=UPI0039E83D92